MTAHEKPEWAQGSRDRRNAQRIAAGLKPRRRIVPWLLVSVAVLGGVGYFLTNPTSEAAAPPVIPAEVIKQVREAETSVIEPVDLRDTVKVTGTLAPASQADVSARVSGQVLNVLVRPGDEVAAGDVLVELDREALSIALNQQRALAEATRAQLISAEQQLQRTEEMAAKKIAAPMALEQARSTAEALRANLLALDEATKAAELSVGDATLRAPIDGVIAARMVEVGQSVAAGTSLLTIVDLDVLEFQATGTARTSAQLRPGQMVELSAVGIEGRTFSGTVTRINPVATPGTRMIPVYVAVENPDHMLRGGMFATGAITVLDKGAALAVPASALREDAGGHYVLALGDGTVLRRQVGVGAQWNGGKAVEVSGLEIGELVLNLPLTRLMAGDRYTLIED